MLGIFRKFSLKSCVVGLLLLSASSAWAGDRSTFIPLGFSPKGSYFAYAQEGTQDGSGFPYAELNVVSVRRNALLMRKSVISQDPNQTPDKLLNALINNSNLSAYAIDPGAYKGTTLYTMGASTPNPLLFGSQTGHSYGLYTQTKALAMPPSCDQNPQLLKVTLFDATYRLGDMVLQRDISLPASRSCAHDYTISQVIQYGNGLVVAVVYQQPGFEGPNTRSMVVTGIVNLK